jgi:hypothetical protein
VNDDELRRLMREQIPEHRADFWTNLEERVMADRPRGAGESDGSPDRTARSSAATPWGANDMSVQHDRPDDARKFRWAGPGWTKLAVAAAAAAVMGGLAVGAEQGGVFSSKGVSWEGRTDQSDVAASTTARSQTSEPTHQGAATPLTEGSTGSATTGTTRATGGSVGQVADPGGLGAVAVPAVTKAVPFDLGQAVNLVKGAQFAVEGTPLEAYTWSDRNGRNVTLITREAVTDSHGSIVKSILRAYTASQLGRTLKQVGRFVDEATGLDLDLFQIKDADHDGIAEIVICFVTKVVGKLTPVTRTVHRLIHGHDYVLRGTGLPESTIAGLNPTELLAVPTSLLSPVLSAVPAADGWPAGSYDASLSLVNGFLRSGR